MSWFQVNLCRTCILLSAKAPEKSEPVLADKEIIMAALNIRSMDFGGNFIKMDEAGNEEDTGEININSVTVLLDLAFANNVRYLDDHEMYLTDQVPLRPATHSRWILARRCPSPAGRPWPAASATPSCPPPTLTGRR